MKQLEFQLKELTYHNRDGSYATQRMRRTHLLQIARQLHGLGYNQMHVRALKTKHVSALLKLWNDLGYSTGTIKNYMSYLRWWARKIGKYNLIPEDNVELDISSRNHIPESSKAFYLSREELLTIDDVRIRHSLELQQEFGLRKEEALKFQPTYADQGDFIRLKGSWTKGGRPRTIPIGTGRQRDLLSRVHDICGAGSMIPDGIPYKTWVSQYSRLTLEQGLRNLHGLRHGYAQRRYEALAGWKSPFAGGPTSRQMTREQRDLDQYVRLTVSRELGHNRIDVTSVYLGK